MKNYININKFLDKYNLKDPWDIVDLFEKKLSSYSGSKYGVAVDCCTHGIFLSLKYLNQNKLISIPQNTYISIPNVINMAGYKFNFKDISWDGFYKLEPLPIIDSACRFTKNMYEKNTLTCLSFHHRKQIAIGRGGMILTDDAKAYKWLKLARYDGRHLEKKYDDDQFNAIGWHMYMTPEQACIGLEAFETFRDEKKTIGGSNTYKNLSDYSSIFNKI
jgi:dTDP-4-amino-4,6-dideoxygalactose transaminase